MNQYFLYLVALIAITVLEHSTAWAINALFSSSHKYAFPCGLFFLLVFVIANMELVVWIRNELNKTGKK